MQISADHVVDKSTSRKEEGEYWYAIGSEAHLRSRRHSRTVRGHGECAVWDNSHQFRILLLYERHKSISSRHVVSDTKTAGYEFSRAFLQRTTKKSQLGTMESMAAGALAGSATVFLTNPIWVVNTRMTARKSESNDSTLPTKEGESEGKEQSPSTIGTLSKIVKEEGIMRLFAGVLPALVLVANPILQYTVYERLKQILEKRRKVGAVDSFLLGALGKLAATTITYPYITVKSRAHVATGAGRQEGMTSSLRRIVREEGVSGLYGGELCHVAKLV